MRLGIRVCLLGVSLLFCVIAFAGEDVYARCRCDRGGGSRRQVKIEKKQERRAARRGEGCSTCSVCPPQSAPQQTPDDGKVEVFERSGEVKYQWQCDGRSCRLVPISPPATQAKPQPPPPKAKEPEKTPEAAPVSDPEKIWSFEESLTQ